MNKSPNSRTRVCGYRSTCTHTHTQTCWGAKLFTQPSDALKTFPPHLPSLSITSSPPIFRRAPPPPFPSAGVPLPLSRAPVANWTARISRIIGLLFSYRMLHAILHFKCLPVFHQHTQTNFNETDYSNINTQTDGFMQQLTWGALLKNSVYAKP